MHGCMCVSGRVGLDVRTLTVFLDDAQRPWG